MGTVNQTDNAPVDVERAIERMHDRGQNIAQKECERALNRLQAQGELSASERRIVRQLADGLAEELLAVPERHLREATEQGDDEATTVALSLFADD